MSSYSRRNFIKLWLIGQAWLCHAKTSHAVWSAENFSAIPFNATLSHLFKQQVIIDTDEISLNLPPIAENGAVVPITISSRLENISRIYILVEKNPTPLAAEFTLTPIAELYLTARLKMAESCYVIIIAQQGEQLLRSRQWVQVMQGGCGTG